MSVDVFIDGVELVGWTDLSLKRSKDDLTGSLDLSIFFTYVPSAPVMVEAVRARQIQVYMGGHLVFNGLIDARTGTGARHGDEGTSSSEQGGASISTSIGPNEYTVKLTCRGNTKYLVDSSVQQKTNLNGKTSREVLDEIISPWGIELEWMGTEVTLDKVRLRDGAKVVDEIQRIATENAYFIYETCDGKLRVTDDTGPDTGEALILGQNILTFSASQSEIMAKSQILVKGQRSKKGIRGEDAVLDCERTIEDSWVESTIPITIQHYGDATEESLDRRANFEANKRSSKSKEVTIEVFHVQSSTGLPWDVGMLHYVEVPPEGIFDVFECTAVAYTVQNDTTLKTTLTLSPPPTTMSAGGGGGFLGAIAGTFGSVSSLGASRRALAGVVLVAGQYPSAWTGPVLQVLQGVASLIPKGLGTIFTKTDKKKPPPKKLPSGFKRTE